MKHKSLLSILTLAIAMVAAIASACGIYSITGPGGHEYLSIRGQMIHIWGRGLYQYMSAEVAPQGIAHDYVTLFIGVPVLLGSLLAARKGSLKGMLVLTGTLAYFLMTYLFYLAMCMYNVLFLAYVFLLATSFFAFVYAICSFDIVDLRQHFRNHTPVRALGTFLIVIAISMGLLWLKIVVPPLLDGSVIPVAVAHYTTLIVQGFDLSIFLPAAFISGVSLLRKKDVGYLLASVYYVFLSLLMAALCAKIIAMTLLDNATSPAIFIIPVFFICSLIGTIFILKNIGINSQTST